LACTCSSRAVEPVSTGVGVCAGDSGGQSLADPAYAWNIGNTIRGGGAVISGGLVSGHDGTQGGSGRVGAVIGGIEEGDGFCTAGRVIVGSKARSGSGMFGAHSGDGIAIGGIQIACGCGYSGGGSHGVSAGAITQIPAIEDSGTLSH
jgi:hypothetical protein